LALADKAADGVRPRVGELILAHADMDPARLGRAMSTLRQLGIGVTSYSSAVDWAMRISRAIRFLTRSRVGARPVHIEGVDAIDITGLSGGPIIQWCSAI
jgi:esterase/lipase superfamily enzyme